MRAFDELYARYESRLFGFCLRMLKSRAGAEDVFHEAFLRALKDDRAAFESGGFRAYLFQIARNLCLNEKRGEARAKRAIDAIPERAPEPQPDEIVISSRRFAALDDAVARLPPQLVEVYELRSSGLSYEEIAAVLAIPIGTIKSRMHQLVKTLREEVKGWTAS